MLNRAVLMQQLQTLCSDLFIDVSPELAIAHESWQRIVADPAFLYKVRQISTPWLVPDWYDHLGTVIPVASNGGPYTVLAVDGSQVYPDRHQGTSCFLINIGSVVLHYGHTAAAPVVFDSKPTVFTGHDVVDEVTVGPELVNCRRQEFELEQGLVQSISLKQMLPPATPFAFLFDGSLIFWHLESKEGNLKEIFLNKYLNILEQLYRESILCAGYISLPKSKELVNLIRIELCKFKIEGCKELQAVDHLVDSAIARFFLPPYARSIVFKSNAKIGDAYPPHLMPHFFYMDVGAEIVRIEIPAWIARDEKLLNQLTAIILNQTLKGNGYPVALAEAHEQAVIKGPDREFFYHLITKMGIEQRRRLSFSQKSMKKRGMGI
jgi:hypothetical protein